MDSRPIQIFVRSVTHDGRRLLERLLNATSAEIRMYSQNIGGNNAADTELISLLREIDRLVNISDQVLKLLRRKYDRSDPESDILRFFRDGIVKTSEDMLATIGALVLRVDSSGTVQEAVRASALGSTAFEFNSFAKKVMAMGETIAKSKIEKVSLKTEISRAKIDLIEKYRHVDWQLVDKTKSSVRANRAVIYLIFKELISNAIKYRDTNRPLLVRITECRSADGGKLLVSVSDNGIGVARDDCRNNRIFTSFWRSSNAKALDEVRQENEGSQGLGLAIVQLAVSYLGGTVSVESELHVGTTFTLALPM